MTLNNKKIFFIYDYLDQTGGAEHVMDNLANDKFFTVIAGYKNKKIKEKFKNYQKISSLVFHLNSKFFRFLLLPIIFVIYSLKLRKMRDIKIITSGQFAIFSSIFLINNFFYYAHSLPKFIFENYKKNITKLNYLEKSLYRFYTFIYHKIYVYLISRHKVIFVNSKYTQLKFKKYLNRKTEVIYPIPEENIYKDCSKIQLPFKKFYLVADRDHFSKNTRNLLSFFNKNKDLNAIFTNNNFKLDNIKSSNIYFTNQITIKEYFYVLSKCEYLISLSDDEDFGLNVYYAHIFNKKVITYRKGNYRYFNNIFIKKIDDLKKRSLTKDHNLNNSNSLTALLPMNQFLLRRLNS